MNKLHKTLLVSLLAAGLGGTAAVAQSRVMEGPGACAGWHFDQNRLAARQAELHDKLALSAEQETAWKTFAEKTKQPEGTDRPDRKALSQLQAPERLEKMLSLMKDREARMSEHLAALKVFYAVLTPSQQKVFDEQFGRHPRRAAR